MWLSCKGHMNSSPSRYSYCSHKVILPIPITTLLGILLGSVLYTNQHTVHYKKIRLPKLRVPQLLYTASACIVSTPAQTGYSYGNWEARGNGADMLILTLVLVAQSCLTVTPWTVALPGSQSMEFSRQGYWSGLPFPSLGDLSDLGIEPRSPALQADSQILYHLSYQGSPEPWVIKSFASATSTSWLLPEFMKWWKTKLLAYKIGTNSRLLKVFDPDLWKLIIVQFIIIKKVELSSMCNNGVMHLKRCEA